MWLVRLNTHRYLCHSGIDLDLQSIRHPCILQQNLRKLMPSLTALDRREKQSFSPTRDELIGAMKYDPMYRTRCVRIALTSRMFFNFGTSLEGYFEKIRPAKWNHRLRDLELLLLLFFPDGGQAIH